MSQDVSILAALIAERMGLSLPKDRWPDLAQALAKAAASLNYKDEQAFVAELVAGNFGQREIEAFARHLTIPETHFFRSPETYAMLQSKVLPELIAAQQTTGRRLRIWSAGCATGPEPFSLAILVSRLVPSLADWDVSILATDINPEGFAAARAAEYTQWSFRGTPSWVTNGYFTKTPQGRYRLAPAIQDMVSFRYLNLVQDPFPSDCDLILCRNVMMYFARETAVQVAEKLRHSLKEGGYLLVTASETSRDIQGSLTSLMMGGEIIYKKTPPEPAAAPSARPQGAAASSSHSAVPNQGNGSDRAVRLDSAVRPRTSRSDRIKKTEPARAEAPHSESSGTPTAQPQRAGLRLERRAYARGETPTEQPARSGDAQAAATEARLLADRGDLQQALARCDTVLQGEKLNPSLYYLKASILQELGRPEEAEQALQSTLFLDGGFALARVMLGAIARSQSRTRDAAKHFREALELLEQMPSDSVLAETNGLTAGEMVETVASLIESERVS
jgi:chemotaxis protein methyltransferase CheR